MNAVITKRQKNSILVLGGIAGTFGAVAGACGLFLREKYLVFEQDWDVDIISGFTEGYFGVMSGFILLLLGTLGYGLIFSRLSCLAFVYWLCSLSCDILCILDTMMIMPYTTENGKFAWEETTENCSQIPFNSFEGNNTLSNTDFITVYEYCQDIQTIAILLIIVTVAVLLSLLLSCCVTFATSVALCRAKSIDNAEQSSIQLAPFSTPDHFQPMSFNNTVYHTDGFRK